MIKNERQYRITKSAAARFAAALDQWDSAPLRPDVDLIVQRAEKEALKGHLDELRVQLRSFEELASGKLGMTELKSLADLPEILVRARIASGMSQRELGEKLGLKEQQIQRYEASDYRQASLSRLLEIAKALKLDVHNDLLLPPSADSDGFFARVNGLGLSKSFVFDRLVPKDLAAMSTAGHSPAGPLIFAATKAVSHIFGWSPAAILAEDRPWLNAGVLGSARFKMSASVQQKALEAYSFYAHFLAVLLLKATDGLPQQPIPNDPDAMRTAIVERYGPITFKNALLYCWDLGIPVLPLADSGAFQGACWRVDGRNVIVLKQRTHSFARWLFDLLHELRHAAEDPNSPSLSVIEEEGHSWARVNSEEEKEAHWFAGEVSLSGRAEQLVEACVQQAQGKIPRLKSVVPEVARANGVDVGALANYLAFRLSLQGENWWGAATNLQPSDESPWETARDELLTRVNLSRLDGIDRDLFLQALTEA